MRLLFILFPIFVLMSSCSRIPEPVGYDHSTQQKMQAAHHWNVLANDLSNKINNELIRSDFLETPIFVKETCGSDSEPCEKKATPEFNEGFRDLLITELVNYGIPTSAIPDREAITVNYKVQVIYHHTKRMRTLRPGLLTYLTTAVAVLRNAPDELIAIGIAGAIDYANTAYAKTSNYEVIITTSMVFRNKYLFRSSDIYYINGADYHHFQQDRTNGHEIQLISSN